MIISSLSWGLGYFGQPHILIRFMAIKNHKDIYIAKIIGILWVLISLTGALLLGLISILYFSHYEILNPENIFIELTKKLYDQHILEGFMIGALLSAIISTISAQIIGVTSAVVEDIYRVYIRKNATNRELLFLSRITILILSITSIIIAINPNASILNKISFAWAGMGASFGPLILISLFYSRVTISGAIAGIFSGSICVFCFPYFKYLGGWFALYELFPSFLISSFFIIMISEIHIYFKSIYFNEEFRDNIYYVKMIDMLNKKL
jgi:sodium/proline symporter